jgi:tetratricopeptide (TPR) repeat protein
MNKKKIITLVIIVVLSIGTLTGYLFWSNYRADYYADNANKTSDNQEKILNLEKSTTLYPKTENIIALVDLYISTGHNNLAEKIMLSRGEVDILNKLGNLYLNENKIKEAENTFIKAKNKKVNSDSLKGLILVELKKSDRGVAENYLNQLVSLDSNSANCYGTFVYLIDFKKSENSFKKAKSCDLYGLDKYFVTFDEAQNPLYLRLEAVNLYYSQNYLNLAEKDILTILKEKDSYRDAHILASKIYEKLGNQAKANEHKQKAKQIDPTVY